MQGNRLMLSVWNNFRCSNVVRNQAAAMGGTLIYWQIDYIWNGFNVLHQLPFEKNKGNFCNFFVNFNSYHSCKLTDDSTSFDPILLLLWLWLYFCFQIALLALSWPYLNDLTMNNHSDIGFCHFSLFMFFFFFSP